MGNADLQLHVCQETQSGPTQQPPVAVAFSTSSRSANRSECLKNNLSNKSSFGHYQPLHTDEESGEVYLSTKNFRGSTATTKHCSILFNNWSSWKVVLKC